MIMDKKGKLFGKISIVDILILLVIIIGIAGTYFTLTTVNNGKFTDNSKLALNSASPTVNATVVMEVKGVRSMTKDGIKVGDEIYTTEDDDGKLLGVIEEVSSKPATSRSIADDGSVYEVELPERYDLSIKISAKGKDTQTGFHTESEFQLLYGKEFEIKTSMVKTLVSVKDIKFE